MLVGADVFNSGFQNISASSSQFSMSLQDCFCPVSVPWVDPLIGLLQVFSLARIVGLCYVFVLFVVLYLGFGLD